MKLEDSLCCWLFAEQILVTSTNCISLSLISGFTLGFVCHFILVLVLIFASMKLYYLTMKCAENFLIVEDTLTCFLSLIRRSIRFSSFKWLFSVRFSHFSMTNIVITWNGWHAMLAHGVMTFTPTLNPWCNVQISNIIFAMNSTILTSAVDNKIIICLN